MFFRQSVWPSLTYSVFWIRSCSSSASVSSGSVRSPSNASRRKSIEPSSNAGVRIFMVGVLANCDGPPWLVASFHVSQAPCQRCTIGRIRRCRDMLKIDLFRQLTRHHLGMTCISSWCIRSSFRRLDYLVGRAVSRLNGPVLGLPKEREAGGFESATRAAS